MGDVHLKIARIPGTPVVMAGAEIHYIAIVHRVIRVESAGTVGTIEDVRLNHYLGGTALARIKVGDLIGGRAIVIFVSPCPIDPVTRFCVAIMVVIALGGVPHFELNVRITVHRIGGWEVVRVAGNRVMTYVPRTGNIDRCRR
jgi:hypothetical protein